MVKIDDFKTFFKERKIVQASLISVDSRRNVIYKNFKGKQVISFYINYNTENRLINSFLIDIRDKKNNIIKETYHVPVNICFEEMCLEIEKITYFTLRQSFEEFYDNTMLL